MSGWRDNEGRTASERQKVERGQERARLAATIRHRPLSLVKPVLGGAFVLIVVIALLLMFAR